jgi:hypothetical protein
MALVPLYRDAPTGAVVGKLKAGTNVTFTEATVSGMLEVTVAASGGGGGGGTPATTVVSGTTPSLSPVVGVSTDYARGDHSHGTPTVPAHTALSALAWASAGHTGSATAIAAWDAAGAASVVQATANETMLVRRAGTLQWVPLVLSVVFLPSSDLIMDDVVYTMNGAVVFPGSIL